MEELKPCPFCGGRAEVQWGYFAFHAYCTESCGCELISPKDDGWTEDEAVAAWNKRA